MTYQGGPTVPSCPSGRTFTYTFMCDRTTPTPPMSTTNYTFVMELSGCAYTAYMYSQIGCATRACLCRRGAFIFFVGAAAAAASRHPPTRRLLPPPPPPLPLRAPRSPARPPSCLLSRFSHAECPVTSAGVCNNKGVCGFDNSAGVAKCKCNSGYDVSDCVATSIPPTGAAVFGALSGGSVIGALCVVAYSYFRLRKPAGSAAASGGDGFYAAS